MNTQLPSAIQVKEQAKRLRNKMEENGTPIRHTRSLELVAHRYGFRDWNSMLGAIENRAPTGWAIGDKVSGTYLSQPFTAKLVAVVELETGWFRMELRLDEAVDVVTSELFSNFRKHIRGVVGPKGYSKERTANGQPHLQIDLLSG